MNAYPHSVYVQYLGSPGFPHFRWRCGCGDSGGSRDERECRDAGFAHQQAHTEAFQAAQAERETWADTSDEGIDAACDSENIIVLKEALYAVKAERDAAQADLEKQEAITLARVAERETLRNALIVARREIDRWGHGDMHYGNMPRDPGVLTALTMIDEVLGD